jgi:hypothetical protein
MLKMFSLIYLFFVTGGKSNALDPHPFAGLETNLGNLKKPFMATIYCYLCTIASKHIIVGDLVRLMEKLQTRLEETPSPVEAVNKAGSSASGVKEPPFL